MKKKKDEDLVVDVETSVEKVPDVKKDEPKNVAAQAPLGKINKPKTVEEALAMAADLAARCPAHAGKSARQHGTDIAAQIRDLAK